jgi:hypothetical protein
MCQEPIVTDVDLSAAHFFHAAYGCCRLPQRSSRCLTVLGVSLRKRLKMSRSQLRKTIPSGASLAKETVPGSAGDLVAGSLLGGLVQCHNWQITLTRGGGSPRERPINNRPQVANLPHKRFRICATLWFIERDWTATLTAPRASAGDRPGGLSHTASASAAGGPRLIRDPRFPHRRLLDDRGAVDGARNFQCEPQSKFAFGRDIEERHVGIDAVAAIDDS